MASLNNVLHYIDIPLQHVHPDTLRRMKRPWDGERYLALFDKVRAARAVNTGQTRFEPFIGYPPFKFGRNVVRQVRLAELLLSLRSGRKATGTMANCRNCRLQILDCRLQGDTGDRGKLPNPMLPRQFLRRQGGRAARLRQARG